MEKQPTKLQEARKKRNDKIRKEHIEAISTGIGSWKSVDKLAKKYKVKTVTIYRILKKD